VPETPAQNVAPPVSSPAHAVPLRELAGFFLRLGTTAFGGPAGHIAMMENELVRRRRWLSREEFLDLLGASNLVPGPSSSELAIHIGYLCGGFPGLLIAGLCFLLPAACMMAALAWLYLRFGKLPAVASILCGIKPVVIAVILQALWGLGKSAVKTKFLALAGLASVVAAYLGLQPILLLLIAGAASVIAYSIEHKSRIARAACVVPGASLRTAVFRPASLAAGTTAAAGIGGSVGLAPLFLVFLKVGAVVFGSGYVLLAFLHADLVVHRGWLTDPQLVDAIALGQVTPGPVFTTATFIGYLLAGGAGAVVATLGIFLPAFVLVALSGPLVPRIRKSPAAGAFLDGVVVASLALMAVVAWQLARVSITSVVTALLAALSLFLLLRFRLNSAWLILLGAVVGILAHGLAR